MTQIAAEFISVEMKSNDVVRQGTCSNINALCNIMLSAVGCGVIMLPTVFARLGWVGGCMVLLTSVLISNITVNKLYFGLTQQPSGELLTTYEDLGKACYGQFGKVFSASCVHVTMGGLCVVLLRLLGENLSKVVDMRDQQELWIVICGCILLPCIFLRSMHHVGYVSTIGVAAILAIMGIVATAGILKMTSGSPSSSADEGSQTNDPEYDLFSGSIFLVATSLGNGILSFNITNTVATLVRDMKKPQDFPRVCLIAYSLIFVVYLVIAGAGYAGWGRELRDGNLTIVDFITEMNEPVLANACIAAVAVMAFPHFVVFYVPIAASVELAVESWVFSKASVKEPKEAVSPSALSWWVRVCVRGSLLGLIVALAVFVPSIGRLIDLLGSVTMMLMVIVLPVVFCWRTMIARSENIWAGRGVKAKTDAVFSGLFILLALVCMVVGTVAAIK